MHCRTWFFICKKKNFYPIDNSIRIATPPTPLAYLKRAQANSLTRLSQRVFFSYLTVHPVEPGGKWCWMKKTCFFLGGCWKKKPFHNFWFFEKNPNTFFLDFSNLEMDKLFYFSFLSVIARLRYHRDKPPLAYLKRASSH